MNKSYVLLSLLFLLSCHQTEKHYEGIELVEIDVDRKACADMSEFIEKIEIVPFQTDTNCLVGEYNKLIYCKELSMYIYMDHGGIVSLFSDDGKFISNSESVRGPGPGEYQIVVDVAYNPFSKAIELLSPYGIIYRYDLSFNFIEKISLNQNKIVFEFFNPLSVDQYVLIPHGNSIMYYCDFSKKEIHRPPLDYNEDGIHVMQMNYNSFFYIEDELFFSPQGVSFRYIYKFDIEGHKLIPYVQLDFGKDNIRKTDLENRFGKLKNNWDDPTIDTRNYVIFKEMAQYLKDSKHPLPLIKFMNEKYVYVYMLVDHKRNTFIYNRKTRQSILQTADSPFKLYICLALNNNVLSGVVQPFDIEKYIDRRYLTKESLQKLEALDEEDNPVIINYYLK
jgi:hypothetical protein